MIALLLAAFVAASAPTAPTEPEEIVVTARGRACSVQLADRVLSNREFKQRAKEWAQGTPVRVYAPRSSDVQCLSKIAFRLGHEGVRMIEFVDRPTPP